MVTLLAPLGLLLLVLLPLALLIHLWRIRYHRHLVSSTLLWNSVLSSPSTHRPRRVPVCLPLLLLQLAVLSCGTLAVTRPSWLSAEAHHYVVVAVDTSFSMSAVDTPPTRLQTAIRDAEHLVDTLPKSDIMTVIDLGSAPRVLVTSDDHTSLYNALKRLKQGYGPSSLTLDAPLLVGASKQYRARQILHLYAPIDKVAQARLLQHLVPHLALHTVGETTADQGVANLTVSCHPASCEATALIFSKGMATSHASVIATVDGSSVIRYMTLPTNSVVPLQITLPISAQTVELHLANHDVIPADNTAWAITPSSLHHSVLLITNDAASPLIQALGAIPQLRLLKTTTADPNIDALAEKADLTILDSTGADVFPPGDLLLINPRDMSAIMPLSGTVQSPTITSVDAGSPLVRHLDLASLAIASATKIQLPPWAHASILSGNDPLLFSGVTQRRRVVALLFDPRSTSRSNPSNLAALNAFPTLLYNAIQSLTGASTPTVSAGQEALIPLSQASPPLIHGSVGSVVLHVGGDVAALPALAPGLYSTSSTGGSWRFAVNPLTTPSPLPERANTTPVLAPLPLSFPTVAPWEVWTILAALALLFLNLEWWYYARHT